VVVHRHCPALLFLKKIIIIIIFIIFYFETILAHVKCHNEGRLKSQRNTSSPHKSKKGHGLEQLQPHWTTVIRRTWGINVAPSKGRWTAMILSYDANEGSWPNQSIIVLQVICYQNAVNWQAYGHVFLDKLY
jgi:hypothetical protein